MIICKHDLPRLRDLLIKEGNKRNSQAQAELLLKTSRWGCGTVEAGCGENKRGAR